MSEFKIHLNLTAQTFYTLLSDSRSFAEGDFDPQKKRPGDAIINRIFCNFCKETAASRLFFHPEDGWNAEALDRYFYAKDKDPKLRFSCSLTEDTRKCLDSYTLFDMRQMRADKERDKKHEELTAGFDPKVKKLYGQVYFSGDGRHILMPRPGKFIKAVLEEYAAMPYYRREEIYFENIRGKLFLRERPEKIPLMTLSLQNGRRKRIYPYRILPDEWNTHIYLVGLDEEGRISNHRLSRIKNVSTGDRREERSFTVEEIVAMEEAIRKKGVMFVSNPIEPVTLALTDAGMSLYFGTTFLRPQYQSITQNGTGRYLLDFACTLLQIEYYFFKFGENVEILSPPKLRKRFRLKYLRAYENHRTPEE